ncbi:hypothetical protein C0J52_20928, partial [Blattella germanica]
TANKDGVPAGSTETAVAYKISAALTYTTQLVNVLAFYLDIRLPNKLCYSIYNLAFIELTTLPRGYILSIQISAICYHDSEMFDTLPGSRGEALYPLRLRFAIGELGNKLRVGFTASLDSPQHMPLIDFCGHEMTETQFAHRVAKLNHNVLHLCFTQNVNPTKLFSTHTLHNILLLLNPEESDLGRYSSFALAIGMLLEVVCVVSIVRSGGGWGFTFSVELHDIRGLISLFCTNAVHTGVSDILWMSLFLVGQSACKCPVRLHNAQSSHEVSFPSSYYVSDDSDDDVDGFTSHLLVSCLLTQGPLEVDHSLAKLLEDQLLHDLELGEESGSDDESDNLHWEWEAVSKSEIPLANENERVGQYECIELSPKYDSYRSFKIGFPFDLLDKVLSPEFWPEGILVKKSHIPRNQDIWRMDAVEDKISFMEVPL